MIARNKKKKKDLKVSSIINHQVDYLSTLFRMFKKIYSFKVNIQKVLLNAIFFI